MTKPFFFAWQASDYKLLYGNNGWENEPVLWWRDVLMHKMLWRIAEKNVYGGGTKGQVPTFNFEELGG